MLTDTQADVLEFIERYRGENQKPPTRAEISGNFGWRSANSAQCHLEALVKKGYIKVQANGPRGIFVMKSAPKPTSWTA